MSGKKGCQCRRSGEIRNRVNSPRCFFFCLQRGLFIFVPASISQMIKVITFAVRIERAKEWFLIIHLAQRESVFVVFQVLAFQGCMATPPATQTISRSFLYRMVNRFLVKDVINPSLYLKQERRTKYIYSLCQLMHLLHYLIPFFCLQLADKLGHVFLPF